MQRLTPQGAQIIQGIAQRSGFSADAVLTMLDALVRGNGTMAQFSHPEFGGSGQWLPGGMTMIGDMFNNALKARVDGLCAELSQLLASQPLFPPPASTQTQSQGSYGEVSLFVPSSGSANWWPDDLGAPGSTGAQNHIRYAIFPSTHRLAIDVQGHVTVYDTLDHQIGGVSQQQSGNASLTFTSQYGLVRVADLPVISVDGQGLAATRAAASSPGARGPFEAPEENPATTPPAAGAPQAGDSAARHEVPSGTAEGDIFIKIEKLAKLRQKGLLTEEEFAGKKAELLSRI